MAVSVTDQPTSKQLLMSTTVLNPEETTGI